MRVMRMDLSDNTMALALFRKEASALHNIHHEAIVRYYVFSLDPEIRRHYLAMEFVEGQPLSELLKHGPLPYDTVRVLQRRLAAGLEAAHHHGIIHRDLSPDNILIPANDVSHAKIIDFGIARSTKIGDGTVIGSGFAGKFNYVSPEQLGLFDGDVKAKSDIYSLGLVLAECLLGKAIDMGGSQFEVIEKRRVVPDLGGIDARLRPLIIQMLQPDPADRPESMAAVAAWHPANEPSVSWPDRAAPRRRKDIPRGTIEPPRPRKTGTRVAITATLALLLLGAGGAGYYLLQDQQTSSSGGKSAAIPSLNPDLGADAQRAEDARRAAAEELARRRVEEAKRLSEQNASAAGATTVPADRPPTDPKERISRFVNAYNGGDCFFIAPVAIADSTATLEGYAATAAPFEVLDYEFKRAHGFEATVGYHAVARAQCPAITFMGRLRNQRTPSPRLDLSAGNLRSNGYITGTVAEIGSRHVELLMIDHDGIVLSLTNLLKDSGDKRTFTINMRRQDAGPPQPQLVFAVTSSKPLEAFKPTQPGSGEIGSADRVFVAAFEEAQQSGQALNVNAKAFNLEK